MSGGKAVVAGQAAVSAIGQCDTVDGDEVGFAHILAIKTGVSLGVNRFCANQAGGDGECRTRCSGTIVGFVLPGGCYSKGFGGYVGSCCRCRIKGVVSGIDAAYGYTSNIDCFAACDVFVDKAGSAVGKRQGVACNTVISQGYCRCCVAVVDFVLAGGCYSKGFGGDVGSCCRCRIEGVVSGIDAAYGYTSNIDCFAACDVFVDETSSAVGNRQSVTSNTVISQSYCRGCGAVVDFVLAGG